MRPDEQVAGDAGTAARTLLMPLEPSPDAALDLADEEDMAMEHYHVGNTKLPDPHPPPSSGAPLDVPRDNVNDSVAARTLSMPRESPPDADLDSADDEDMEMDEYHVGNTEVPVPHPHPSRSAKRTHDRNRRYQAARGLLARAQCPVVQGSGSGADLEPAPGGRDTFCASTQDDVISASSDLGGGYCGAGVICGSGSGDGRSNSADAPFPQDKCASDDNAQPAHYGPTASGGMRPTDGGDGGAAVVEVDDL